MRSNIIIAIDGYSSCGKSTLAKALAKRLNFIYVDSGAMYRATTLYFLNENVDLNNELEVENALKNLELNFNSRDYQSHITLNGKEVSEEIREMHVSEKVSEVSALKAVRQAMVKQQQKMGKSKNIVMDGRDIGTQVFPDAQIKLFMVADPLIRAERRYNELNRLGYNDVTFDEVLDNLNKRDYADTTRKESPLIKADDAITLDNSKLTEAEQLAFALDKVRPFYNFE